MIQPFFVYASPSNRDATNLAFLHKQVAKIEWIEDQLTGLLAGVSVYTKDGSYTVANPQTAANWNYESIEYGKIRVVRTGRTAASAKILIVSESVGGFENKLVYEWSNAINGFALRELLRVKTRILTLDQQPVEANSDHCITGVRGETSSLFDFSREIDKKTTAENLEPASVDNSCEKIRKSVEQSVTALSVDYPANGKRFGTCFKALVRNVKRDLAYSHLSNGFQKGVGSSKIRCDVANPKAKLAAINPDTHEIFLSKEMVENPREQSSINKVLFHEWVHGSGINDEGLTESIVACCSENLDEMNPACKNARTKIAEEAAAEPNKKPQPTDAGESGAPHNLTTVVQNVDLGSKTAEAKATVPDGGVLPSQSTPVDLASRTDKAAGVKDQHLDLQSGSFHGANPSNQPVSSAKSMIGSPSEVVNASTKFPATAPLPSHILAAGMNKPGAPEAVAQQSHAVIKAGIAAAKDAFKQVDFDKIAASTVGVPTAQAQESAASGPRHTNSAGQTPAVDADGNQIVFQTKVVGQNTDGTPKIQLPNGTLLPSFKAFGNVEPAQTAPQVTAPSQVAAPVPQAASVAPARFAASPSQAPQPQMPSQASTSRSAPANSARSSPSTRPAGAASNNETMMAQAGPAARNFAVASGAQAQARASGNSASGSAGGGSSGSSFGGSSGASGGGRTPSSAQRAASGAQKFLSVSQLKPRSQTVSDLQNVQVNSWSDVKVLIRSAKAPDQLLKQQWFIDHLERQDIRAQVVDHGVGYGSSDPLVRYDLKFLSAP